MSDYDALRTELDALRKEVAALRAERPAPRPAEAAEPEEPVSRRALLGKLAGAAVAGAGMAAFAAEPASAAAGGNFILGAGNDSQAEGSSLHNVSAETTLDVYNGGTGSAVQVTTTSTTGSAPALLVLTNNLGPCVDAAHLNSNNTTPVIQATAPSNGTGVRGTGYTGVHGRTVHGIGVHAVAEGSGTGMNASCDSGNAVSGYSNGGFGLWAYGGRANMYLLPDSVVGPPTSGEHARGEVHTDANGALWLCVGNSTAPGHPGTWAKPGFNAVPAYRVVNAVNIGAGLTISPTVVGVGGVPSTAKAVAIAVNATANANTYLTVYAAGAPRPVLANVHVAPQYVWDTTTIAPVGTSGKVTIYNRLGTAKVYAYVIGYFL